LRAIQDTGSLKAATERLGISYRKAWGDLSKAERTLGIAFLEKRRGGRTGGETRLTETGRRWMTEYGRFQAKVEKTVDAAFQTWLKRIRE
jgi:molybdate transport repressor ModE-like protein